MDLCVFRLSMNETVSAVVVIRADDMLFLGVCSIVDIIVNALNDIFSPKNLRELSWYRVASTGGVGRWEWLRFPRPNLSTTSNKFRISKIRLILAFPS